jgi:hypothetical protein
MGFFFRSRRSHPTRPPSLAATLACFLCLAGLLYAAFFTIFRMFPGFRSGSEQIYSAKVDYVRHSKIFRQGAACRVLVCGDSRTLSGFQSRLFDQLAGTNVSSFNLGLPGSESFIWEPETLTARGEAPTHVLLTRRWGTNDSHDLLVVLRSDDQLMWRLFPFRKLPRDLVLFTLRAREHGGLRAYYRRVLGLVAQMQRDQGYHFIESASHYPGHRLPDNYRQDGDDPHRSTERELPTEGPIFERLKRAMQQGGFQVLVVPSFYREGAVAPVQPNEATRERLAAAGIRLCGPDYWVLPPRYFSDPDHLNPDGAREYTERLWRLVEPWLKDYPSRPADGSG